MSGRPHIEKIKKGWWKAPVGRHFTGLACGRLLFFRELRNRPGWKEGRVWIRSLMCWPNRGLTIDCCGWFHFYGLRLWNERLSLTHLAGFSDLINDLHFLLSQEDIFTSFYNSFWNLWSICACQVEWTARIKPKISLVNCDVDEKYEYVVIPPAQNLYLCTDSSKTKSIYEGFVAYS